MRNLRLDSGMVLGLFLAIGCQDGTGLRTAPDAGRNGGTGGGTAGTGGGPAGTGGGSAATGGGAGASATGGSGTGGIVGPDAAANPDSYARGGAGGGGRDGMGGTIDARSLPGSGGSPGTDARDSNVDTLPDSRGDGGPDAAVDRSPPDLATPDAKDAPAREAQGPVDSGATESGAVEAGSVCSEVPCLAVLFLPCQPVEPCTSEDSGATATGDTTNTCYANGVKQQAVTQLVGNDLSGTFTEKRETGVCFTIEVSLSIASASPVAVYVFRDGVGNQVATGTAAVNTNILIVTCNGGTPTTVSQACLDTASVSSACTTGTCAF